MFCLRMRTGLHLIETEAKPKPKTPWKKVWHSSIFIAHSPKKKVTFSSLRSHYTRIVFFSFFIPFWALENLMISTWSEKEWVYFWSSTLDYDSSSTLRAASCRFPSSYTLSSSSLLFYYLLIMVFRFKHNYMSLYLMVNLSENHFRPGSSFR